MLAIAADAPELYNIIRSMGALFFALLFVVIYQTAKNKPNLEPWQAWLYSVAAAVALVAAILLAVSLMTRPVSDVFSFVVNVSIVVYALYCILHRPNLTLYQKRMFGVVALAGLLQVGIAATRFWPYHY